jgi:DNA-binding Lrp family transcriptional regulator
MLEFVDAGRGDRALIDGLILVAMVQANVAQVTREPELQRTYGSYEEALPDDLRRPLSVSAIANSLRLPYETVRRRVAHLSRRGYCVMTPAGAYVPQEALSSPEHMAGVFAIYELLRQFYYRLSDLGLLHFPASPAPPASGVELVRAIMRLLGEYFLRTVDAITLAVDDLVAGFCLLGIMRANTEDMADEAGEDEPGGFPPNALRKPISVAALAGRLRLPPETVRRHVSQLVADGRCVRTRGGLIIPTEFLDRPHLAALVAENVRDMGRMFSGLAELGVLSAWDATRAPAALSPQTGSPA